MTVATELPNGGLERAVAALRSFQTYRAAEFEAAARALEGFRAASMNRFDLFRIAGVRVNENQFSDALVALLDSRAAHGLNSAPFETFLRCIPTPTAARIASEIAAGMHYSVRPQRAYGDTTPDILVFGDTFVVLIEHKVRRGRETLTKAGKQTVRQGALLARLADERGLPSTATLGVLLSPEGTLPAERSFVALRTGGLLGELRKCLRTMNVEGTGKTSAFLELWEEFNA